MADPTPKSALKPDPKVAPTPNPKPVMADMGRASGVSTDTRIMTSGGPASVPLAVPTLADSASVEMMKRWESDEVALDNAALGGITISRKQKEMRRKQLNASNATVSTGCQQNLDVYTATANQGGIQGSAVGSWICGLDDRIKFRETQYQNQANEFRLYIEGADVTNYVEGSISWTFESTGGMNSCRFTLNNTQDAFIITPENVCAGLNPAGWRVGSDTQVKDNPGRSNWRVDETAKYIIYRNKYNAVDPAGPTPQIDQQTGMWLFPLNPYSCIFNRHDCVRMFVRLPHVSAVRATDKKAYDLWMPAFTGFIKDYSWDDDPVAGTRYVKVTCYDYRGILERMRVAIAGAGLPSPNPTTPSALLNRAKTIAGAAAAADEQAKPGEQNKGPSTYDFLIRASKVGLSWKRWFENNKLTGDLSETNKKESGSGGDPYAWAQSNNLIKSFTELYKSALSYAIIKRNINDQPAKPGPLVAGSQVAGKEINPTDPRMTAAIREVNDELDYMVCNVVEGIGLSLALAALYHSKTGVQYTIKMAGPAIGPGVPPRFTTELVPAPAGWKAKPGGLNASTKLEMARQALIKAYDNYAGPASIGSAVPSIKVPTGCKDNCPPTSIAATAQQYFDFTVLGNDSTYVKQGKANVIGDSLRKIHDYFSQIAAAYLKVGGAEARVKPYIPLQDLMSQSVWTSPASLGKINGVGSEKARNASNQYLNSVVQQVAACKKALSDESANSTPPASDKDASAFNYMAAQPFSNKQPNWDYIESFRVNRTGVGYKFYPWPLNYTSEQFGIVKAKYEEAIRKQSPNMGARQLTQLRKVSERTQDMHATGPSRALAGANEVRTLGAIVKKFVEVDKAKVGIFGDLIHALTEGHPHPLAGKNFETAVHFLCTQNSELDCGMIYNIQSYAPTQLDKWNRVVLFGAVQRPLTFREMQEIGRGTIRDFNSDFCPLKAFYHILLPANGVGVQSVVKMHVAGTVVSSPEEPTFTTRLQLLNEICESLDYQFFVSGMGDLIFEVPVYNAYPDTFGPVFSGAYTISKDWINSSISEENQDVPTAWVVSGSEVDLRLDQAKPKGESGKDHFDKITIMNHTMVRRLGVKVETIPLKIPGLGSNFQQAGSSTNALQQLAVYASFYIQRQLGKAHTLSVKYPFRPYVVPNRPLWLIPRQRIGLATSVTHTMTPPQGQCTTDSTIGYVRWMFRDGTFRFIGGGDRQPMDYVGFFRGAATYIPTEGIPAEGPLSLANLTPRLGGSAEAPSDLANRIRAANAFSTNVSASFAELSEPPSIQSLEQSAALNAVTLGDALVYSAEANRQAAAAGAVGTPGSSAAKTGAVLDSAPAKQKNQAAAGASQQITNARNPGSTKPPPVTGSESSYRQTATPDLACTGFSVDGTAQPASKKCDWQNLNALHAWKGGYDYRRFNSWGLVRAFNEGKYGEYARGERPWHPGLDIMGREGTKLIAPVPFDKLEAGIDIYLRCMRKENRSPYAWPDIKVFNSTPTTVNYPVYTDDGYPVMGPDLKQSTAKLSGMVKNKFFVDPFPPGATSVRSYAEYYDQYVCVRNSLAVTKYCPKAYHTSKGGRGLVVSEVHGPRGLWFSGRGWYTAPPDRAAHLGVQVGARLRIELVYIHMVRFAEDAVSNRGILGADYQQSIEAGTVIGYMGNTGLSAQPHLHVNMYVLSPDSGTDENSFKAIASLNADYLTSQLVAMITGWAPSSNSPLSPELLNSKVDSAMLTKAFAVLRTSKSKSAYNTLVAHKNNKTTGNLTVADLVALYKRDPDISQAFRSTTNLKVAAHWEKKTWVKERYTWRFQTNPLFFFTPDQLVDMGGVLGATTILPGEGGSSAATGSYGTSAAPLGNSPAYNGMSMQWCAGLMGSTNTAAVTAAAKNQQASAAAGKNTAANPQNKAVEDEKLKQKLAKNNAPVEAAAASQKTATKNPEAVRRKFDALSKKARNSTNGAVIPGAGVSPNTGGKSK